MKKALNISLYSSKLYIFCEQAEKYQQLAKNNYLFLKKICNFAAVNETNLI